MNARPRIRERRFHIDEPSPDLAHRSGSPRSPLVRVYLSREKLDWESPAVRHEKPDAFGREQIANLELPRPGAGLQRHVRRLDLHV
jgi:hypothetical protein